MPRRKLFPIAGLAAVAMLWLAPTHGAKPRDEMLELYGVFVDAVEQVEANYVRPVPRKELLENALKGMLLSLDPHSTYFTQAEWTQFLKEIGYGSTEETNAFAVFGYLTECSERLAEDLVGAYELASRFREA